MNTINNINNTQFKGIIPARVNKKVLQNEQYFISSVLHQNSDDIMMLTKNITDHRLGFLRSLADRYNRVNFYRNVSEKEDSQIVNNIYTMVKNPKKAHFALIKEFKGSIAVLKDIFTTAGNNKSKLNFAQKVNYEILSLDDVINENLIPELLNSPNNKEYIKHFSKYKSYLQMNRKEKNVVSNLDSMVNFGTFDGAKYDNLLRFQKLSSDIPFYKTDLFNSKSYVEHYSPEGDDLLRLVALRYRVTEQMMKNGNDKDILDILKSTTKENFSIRKKLLTRLYDKNESLTPDSVINTNLSELNELFKRIDGNKHAKNFVTDMIDDNSHILTASEFNVILGSISNLKLDIFSDNAANITRKLRDGRVEALQKELENPFFRMHKKSYYPQSISTKLKAALARQIIWLINKVNIVRYNVLKGNDVELMPANVFSKPNTQIVPEIKVKPEFKSEKIQEVVTETEPKEELVVAKKTVKEDVQSKISEIIQSKLGAKTLEAQRMNFESSATKMRLNMLPEIFSSIADTRKADRAVGKRRINSSNKDALSLFMLINGNNKKYVNYLLKKRNVDNTRMFEVKDIIRMIQTAESKIAEAKKANPEYKARDARRYYNHLYESKIQQYGKITRQQKVSTKA